MKKNTIFVGLDVHKDSIDFARLIQVVMGISGFTARLAVTLNRCTRSSASCKAQALNFDLPMKQAQGAPSEDTLFSSVAVHASDKYGMNRERGHKGGTGTC